MSFNNTNTDILLAGAFAAFSVDLLVYPLDTIKTRVQSPDYKRLYTNASTNTVNRSLFRGLYQGIGSVVIATVPSCKKGAEGYFEQTANFRPLAGAFFTTYEGAKSFLHRLNPSNGTNGSPMFPTPFIHSVASSVAELVSCFILTPAEVLKQNAQMVQKSASASTQAFDANATIQALRRFKKPSQLWRGYTTLAARNLPFTAMQFPMFEHLKQAILSYRQQHGIDRGTLLEKGMITAVAAGTAGSIAAVITTPVDVVKTRIMLSAAGDEDGKFGEAKQALKQIEAQGVDGDAELKRKKTGRSGGFAVGRKILREEGVKALFRGGTLRAVWTALGSGLYLGVYETGRTYLEARRTPDEVD
ncbi:hypothetical protein MMC11_008927 [Xylographa trunciseda]|nr:hypothetical protein [Xylographa trunciseda]